MAEQQKYEMQFSDYSFLERSVHDVYVWIWFIVHVWRCDRFSSLNWKRILSLELKSFVTIFILFALPLGSFYDIVTTKITYFEGFYKFPDNAIRSKPKWLWSEEDQSWYIPSYYILMVGLSLQTTTLFLLQCFWNYLTNSIAKTSFMSRGEFAFYIVWGIISIAIYPVLPFVFRKKEFELYLEAVPQLVYASQLLILVLLGIRTHIKFIGLINLTSSYKNSANIIAKLRYFIDMNKLLTTSLAVTSLAFYVLSIDLLTSSKIINKSKVASDLLVAHVNFATLIEWLALILIFYPRKGFVGTGAGGSTFNTNLGSVPSVNPPTSQISYSNSVKLNNVPPGTGVGINPPNNERHQKPPSIVDVNQPNNYQTTIKSVPISTDFDNVNNNNDASENSQKSTIQKQSSFKRFKKKPVSSVPLSDSNSDLSNSENDGNKPVYLKRNISISKDGKMVYGETKPLGKVKGAEFVAVEKADPSFIPSYYFSNEIKDRSGNVVRIPSILNDQKFRYEIDNDNDAGNSSDGVDQQGIKQVVTKQETIEPQHSTIQENNHNVVENGVNDKQNSDDDSSDDEFFYAM